MRFQECLLFFFSSRRRHTRYIGDWSSDVCSSDLDNATVRFRWSEHAAWRAIATCCRDRPQIGRASCRERVLVSVVVVSLKTELLDVQWVYIMIRGRTLVGAREHSVATEYLQG